MIFIKKKKKKSFSFGITESNVIWRPTDLMVSVLDSESSLRHLTRRTGLHFGRILGEQRQSAKKKNACTYTIVQTVPQKILSKKPVLQATRHLTHNWWMVPGNLGVPLRCTNIPSILSVTSCYRNRDKSRPEGPLGSKANFSYLPTYL